MVRSFIRQLSTSPLPGAINQLWEKHQRRSSDPDIAELIGILDNLIDSFGEVFIIIDALDECPQIGDQREREKLLSLILNLLSKHSKNLHILATSRPEFDIHSELKSYPTIDIGRVVDGDIRCFVKDAIYSRDLKDWGDDIKEYIEKKLLEVEERYSLYRAD
jgi:NACHT domain-containing protein